ncbi:unnamed protein product [Echinostoma caproni]|uniref:Uncharacterized protein n=1 Tax=Echinostoma caproni TaxID=27848 RepID=A0A183A493_9TREM|nr:unnamed protein product [Echinostoma caproni]
MRINASKSASMMMMKDGKRKHRVLTQDHFEVDGSPLKSMSPVDEAKYMGPGFTWKGRKAVRHTGKLNEMLGDLTKAPLKPHQRLELLRVFAIPKLVHDLTLGVAHRNTLKYLDRMIRETQRARIGRSARTENPLTAIVTGTKSFGPNVRTANIPISVGQSTVVSVEEAKQA